MEVERIAAFTLDGRGGNPAGVVICEALPEDCVMQALAAEIGYSETVFAAPAGNGYRVRYFAPEVEIPFCGHATIALGAALARRGRRGPVALALNNGEAIVEGHHDGNELGASLLSPPTRSEPAPPELVAAALALFALEPDDLDETLPPAITEAGVRHLLLPLRERGRLAAMRYDMASGADLMRRWGLATISLVQAESPSRFHSRNPFAAGGVYEDPATGAAAAALAGYLRRIGRTEPTVIEIVQGEDMGIPCLLRAELPHAPDGPVRVNGKVRMLDATE